MIVVLHLCLGQGGLVSAAPVDRLQSTVHAACPHEFGQLPENYCLIAIVHGGIRMLPISQYPEPLELISLHVNKAGGILPGQPSLFHHAYRLRLRSQLLVHLELDGQPMAVPAWDIDSVIAHHGPGLDDQVLQDLVQRVAHVDMAVGVRRTIVEDPHLAVSSKLPELTIDPTLLPEAQNFGLALRQVRLHGKGRFRQVESRLVVHHGPETKAPIESDEGLVTAVENGLH